MDEFGLYNPSRYLVNICCSAYHDNSSNLLSNSLSTIKSTSVDNIAPAVYYELPHQNHIPGGAKATSIPSKTNILRKGLAEACIATHYSINKQHSILGRVVGHKFTPGKPRGIPEMRERACMSNH